MKDKNQRWNSAQEMAEALRGHRQIRTVKREALLPRQARRIPLSAFILLLVALIGVTFFAVVLATREAPVETVEIVVTATIDPKQPTARPDETLEPIVMVITATAAEPAGTSTTTPSQTAAKEPIQTATRKATETAPEEATQEASPPEEVTQEATQKPTLAPTATAVPSTPTLIPTEVEKVALLATEPPLPTNTPIPTLPPPTSPPTNTPLPTQPPATATLPPTATLAPSPTLPPPATATIAPTATAVPAPPTFPPTATLPPPTATFPPPTNTAIPPTATKVPPSPTMPPPPTATEMPQQLPPAVLLAPHDEAAYTQSNNTLNDTITFEWQWNGTLQGSQYFDLRVWKDQQGVPHSGIAGPKITTHQIRASTLDPSNYFWTVVVFDPETGQALTEETAPRRFSVSR